jgi:hypothetical protein
MHDFQRGPLRKPSVSVQARAAFESLRENYHPDFHQNTMKSLNQDQNYSWLRTMVCLQIANVIPDMECDDRKQELWDMHLPNSFFFGIFGTHAHWKQVMISFEHAKECGWTAFMSQKAHNNHESRHSRIEEQIAPNHFQRIYQDVK